ncbi:MAG TPA: tryptophan synthase subunit alpha [Burkholderiales bacterium]|nr:tryptophan synthase subunit alpha [Burkholderiales bacterium]
MPSRIQKIFEGLARNNKKALIPFVTAGDPAPKLTVPLMHALVDAGADIIELGVPFSDPMADGPVIQRASERALKHGVGLDDVLVYVSEFRKKNQNTAVVLMGYANPIEAMGIENFAQRAQAAGVDGVLVVDYPPEECAVFAELVRRHGLDLIFLLAPTSTQKRIEQLVKLATGYIYYVSLRGVTGATSIDIADVQAKLQPIRAQTKLPLGVGFGIRDGETARAVAGVSDAVVIGSRLIQEMENAGEGAAVERAGAFLAGIREALDRQ